MSRFVLLLLLAAHVAHADDVVLPQWLRFEPAPPLKLPRGRPLPRRPAGNVSTSFEYTHISDAAAIGSSATYALGQHAVILPKDGIGVSMQDLVLGEAGHDGFVYQLDYLGGFGHWLGAGGLAIAGGIGVDGIMGGRIPIGMRLPLRAWSSVNVGPSVRLEASGEVAWIAWTQARRGRGAAFGDELVGRVGIYIEGRAREAGCFIGFTAREAMGTTMFTFGLGVGLAASAVD